MTAISTTAAVEPVVARLDAAAIVGIATELARGGKLAEAADILGPIAHRDDLKALELQARIHAQRGQYADAIGSWSRVLSVDPANASAREGIRTAQRQPRAKLVARVVAIVAMISVLIIGVRVAKARNGHAVNAPARTVSPVANHPVPGSNGASLTLPSVAGWRQKVIRDGLMLLPVRDLFSSGVHLSRSGAADVDALSAELHDVHGITVHIQGLTDERRVRPKSRFYNNDDIATERAAAIAGMLSRRGIPESTLFMRPGRMTVAKSLRGVSIVIRDTIAR